MKRPEKYGMVFILPILLTALVFIPAAVFADSITYSTDADFDTGVLNGLNHDAPNTDQLQLNITGTTFPTMWIANAGEDTVSKIDTVSNRETARYRTWFAAGIHGAWTGPAPSRTAVDGEGNVYVANRHFDMRPASVMKILAEGGIDRNGNGVIDTSRDLNGDGRITADEMLPLIDSNGNGIVDPNELADERVAWHVQVGPANGLGRSLCIDGDGFIWLGLFNRKEYYKLDPESGSVVSGPHPVPITPYGCLVDGSGILWSASLGSYLGRLDTHNPGSVQSYYHGDQNYGIALGNGKVYLGGGSRIKQFDPATNAFGILRNYTYTLGLAVDGNGNVIVNHSSSTLYKLSPTGAVIWSNDIRSYGFGEIRGMVVDSDNNIWAVHLTASGRLSKYRGSDGAYLGNFPVGANPYTYSDATGFAVRNTTTPTGFWTVAADAGTPGAEWGTISWNGSVPTNGVLKVSLRTAESVENLALQTYTDVANGVPFTAIGRYAQIRVTMSPGASEQSPVLYDLTANWNVPVTNTPPVAHAGVYPLVSAGTDCQGTVMLDGSGSSDPDGDSLSYAWVGPFGDASGQKPTVTLPLGTHTVTLTVDDGNGETDTAVTTVTVADTTPPVPALDPLPTLQAQCELTVTTPPTAMDNCAETIAGTTQSHLSFSEQGEYEIEWVFDDGNGNTITQTQSVIVYDSEAPVIGNVTLKAEPAASDGKFYTDQTAAFSFTVTDTCDTEPGVRVELNGEELEAIEVTGDGTIMVSFPLADLAGANVLKITAWDNTQGNEAQVEQSFTVLLRLAEGMVIIKPESLKVNPGEFIAFVVFPEPYDVLTIFEAWADGAADQKINLDNDAGKAIIKFDRADVDPDRLDTEFEVTGTFIHNGAECSFIGYDTIMKVDKEEVPAFDNGNDKDKGKGKEKNR